MVTTMTGPFQHDSANSCTDLWPCACSFDGATRCDCTRPVFPGERLITVHLVGWSVVDLLAIWLYPQEPFHLLFADLPI